MQGGNNNAGALGLTLTRTDEFSIAQEGNGLLCVGETTTSSTVPYVSHFMAQAPIVDGSPALIEVDRAVPNFSTNMSASTGGVVTKVIGSGFSLTSWSVSARLGFTAAGITIWMSDTATCEKVSRGVGAGHSLSTFSRMLVYFTYVLMIFVQDSRLLFLSANDGGLRRFHLHFRTPFQL